MKGFDLAKGERVVFASKRGGKAAYSSFAWIGFVFLGMHVMGAVTNLAVVLSMREESFPTPWLSIVTLPLLGALIVRWILLKTSPSLIVTDRRVIEKRLFLPKLEIPGADVAGAKRLLQRYYSRYGGVHEVLSHRVTVGLKAGGTKTLGPCKDADELVDLLAGAAAGVVDPRLLAGVDGEPSRAEERSDVFFALASSTAGQPRGPVFVGPTRVVGFAEPLLQNQIYRILSVVGAESPADEIEARVVDLGEIRLCGRVVVMDRVGATLMVEGQSLVLSSGDARVAFDLAPKDAERAKKFTHTGSVYRS